LENELKRVQFARDRSAKLWHKINGSNVGDGASHCAMATSPGLELDSATGFKNGNIISQKSSDIAESSTRREPRVAAGPAYADVVLSMAKSMCKSYLGHC
jgi:hypothetical protein